MNKLLRKAVLATGVLVALALGGATSASAADTSPFDNGTVMCWPRNSSMAGMVSVKPPWFGNNAWTDTGKYAFTFELKVYDSAGRYVRTIQYTTATGSLKLLWAGSSWYPNSLWQAGGYYGTVWTYDPALTNHVTNYPTLYVGVGYYVRAKVYLWSVQRNTVVQSGYAPNDDNLSIDYCNTSAYATFP